MLLNQDESLCGFCNNHLEEDQHLFVQCHFARNLWIKVFTWLEIHHSVPDQLGDVRREMLSQRTGRKVAQIMTTIWVAVIWTLWRTRNSKIFGSEQVDVEEAFVSFQLLSWKWVYSKRKVHHFSCSDWLLNPNVCISYFS